MFNTGHAVTPEPVPPEKSAIEEGIAALAPELQVIEDTAISVKDVMQVKNF